MQPSLCRFGFTRRPGTLALALLGLCAAAAPLGTTDAAHVNTSTYVEARGNAGAGNALGSSGVSIWLRSGAIVGEPFVSLGGDGTVDWSAGPLVPGSSRAVVATEGAAQGASYSTFASAHKRRGELKAAVATAPSTISSVSAGAEARFVDALWFSNSTDAALPVVIRMQVDGLIEGDTDARAEVFSQIGLSSLSCNPQQQCITPDPSGLGAASFAIYADIDQQAGSFGFRNQFGGQVNGDIPWWVFQLHPDHAPAQGRYDFSKSITLWVPSGETTLVLDAWLRITICQQNRLCDFGNTSAIRIDPLPPGLSLVTQSGELLNPGLFGDGFE